MRTLSFVALSFIAAAPAMSQDTIWDSRAVQIMAAPGQSVDANDPGSSVYPVSSFKVTNFTTRDRKQVRIWTPLGVTGKRPLVVWGGGKSLGNVTNYQAMLEHLVKKGMVVAHVQFEGNFFDTDFVKFGRWYNQAVVETLAKEPLADASQITYAGHSLGAQVSVIAAGLATGDDPQNLIPDPKGLVTNAFDNSCGPNCSGDLANPAKGFAAKIAPTVHTTILEFEDDTIAGPSKRYAEALYNRVPSVRKQWLRVKGKAFGASAGLDANHNTPLTGGGAPFNIGGRAALNALDWYAGWKVLAGLPLMMSGLGGTAMQPYVYGAQLVDGGVTTDGLALKHSLQAQSF
jgi:hypothetical protein